MPTFSNRGGRVFAGGDVMPLFICPLAQTDSADSQRKHAEEIELYFLKLTFLPFLSRLPPVLAGWIAFARWRRPAVAREGLSAPANP